MNDPLALILLSLLVIAPVLAGFAAGLLLRTQKSRWVVAILLVLSATAFIAVRFEHLESDFLARASLMGMFFTFGLSGPALIDDWIVAAIASVVVPATCGFFVIGLALIP